MRVRPVPTMISILLYSMHVMPSTKGKHLQSDLVFAAISNADRRRILDILRSGEKPAGDLVESLSYLPQPAVSRHLKVLREAGLVAVAPRAQQRIYSLHPDRLRELDDWVSHYRGFWSGKLDSVSRPGAASSKKTRRGR